MQQTSWLVATQCQGLQRVGLTIRGAQWPTPASQPLPPEVPLTASRGSETRHRGGGGRGVALPLLQLGTLRGLPLPPPRPRGGAIRRSSIIEEMGFSVQARYFGPESKGHLQALQEGEHLRRCTTSALGGSGTKGVLISTACTGPSPRCRGSASRCTEPALSLANPNSAEPPWQHFPSLR